MVLKGKVQNIRNVLSKMKSVKLIDELARSFTKYSSFTLAWLIVNDFQVQFFYFNHGKQWKLSACKKDINQVRVNELQTYYRVDNKIW